MTRDNFIPELYRAIDAKDTERLVSYMTEDAIFRFANMPVVDGKARIIVFLEGFFQSIKAIRHTDLEYWNSETVWFTVGHASYTRHNDTILRVPFSVLLRMKNDLIKEFQIFVDNSELYK